MAKRKLTKTNEYTWLCALIERKEVETFTKYFSEHESGYDLDVHDLSMLQPNCQVPLLFHACRGCSQIGIFLINTKHVDVTVTHLGWTVLDALLRNHNKEVSLDLVNLILQQMFQSKVKVPQSLIGYVEVRTLLERENSALVQLLRSFDLHNASLESLATLESGDLNNTESRSHKRQCMEPSACNITTTYNSQITLLFGQKIQSTDTRFSHDVQQLVKRIARSMDVAVFEIAAMQISQLTISISEIIALHESLQNMLGNKLTLPQMYLQHRDYFPAHFLILQVELVRKYQTLKSMESEELADIRGELYQFGQVIGAEQVYSEPKNSSKPHLWAS